MNIKISPNEKKLVAVSWNNDYRERIESLVDFHSHFPDEGRKNSVAILFSGGYDSTALMIKALEAGKYVYPIDIQFHPTHTLIKKIILTKLSERFPNQINKMITITNMYSSLTDCFETAGFSQQPMCGFFAAFIPAYVMENVEEVQAAYVLGDAANSFLDNITAIYENTLKFKLYEFKTPKLVFPFKCQLHERNVDLVNKYNLPCYAGDNSQFFKYGRRGDSYFIQIKDENPSPALNKAGDMSEYYTIEIRSVLDV